MGSGRAGAPAPEGRLAWGLAAAQDNLSEIQAGPGSVRWIREHPGIRDDGFFPRTHSFTELLRTISSGFPSAGGGKRGTQLGALGPPTGLDTVH